jgi:hypothetical protein
LHRKIVIPYIFVKVLSVIITL